MVASLASRVCRTWHMAALRASVDRQSHTSASTRTLIYLSGAPLFKMDMFLATPQIPRKTGAPKLAPMSATHSMATTIDTTEGWTFTSEFPTTTTPDDNWSIAATTTNNRDALPTVPTPPPDTDDHVSLHWTACYDDYCSVHCQMKDNNYSSHGSRRRHLQICNCPFSHPKELLQITREQHLNPRKAYTAWYKGKGVCSDCWFLVQMENHHLRCSAAPLADIAPPQQESALIEYTPKPSAIQQDEQISHLTEVVTLIHQTTTQDALRHHVAQRTLKQRMDKIHDTDQQRLQRMNQVLVEIVTE